MIQKIKCFFGFHEWHAIAHDHGCKTTYNDGRERSHNLDFLRCKHCHSRKFMNDHDNRNHGTIHEIEIRWLHHNQIGITKSHGFIYHDDYQLTHETENWEYFAYAPNKGEVIPLETVIDNT